MSKLSDREDVTEYYIGSVDTDPDSDAEVSGSIALFMADCED